MDRVRNLISCDQLHRLGYTGRGVGVAVLDTGECVTGMQKLWLSGFIIWVRNS